MKIKLIRLFYSVGSKCKESQDATDGYSSGASESQQYGRRSNKLLATLQHPPCDPNLDADVPQPEEPESDLREVQIRRKYRDPTQLRRDRTNYDQPLQNGAI